jgi:hypothetical protein
LDMAKRKPRVFFWAAFGENDAERVSRHT